MKVIYVTGYGRSGSTILDIALAQHPDVFGAGEISAMCRHVWRENEYCACGERIKDCAVWAPIMKRWASDAPERYFALQRAMEPLLSPGRAIGGERRRRFVKESTDLFRIISEVSGQRVVLDSSKAPGRGLALSHSEDLDLRVIHLVRDARAVAHSMTRSYSIDLNSGLQKEIRPRPYWRTSIRWISYNAQAERLLRKVGPQKSVRVRYEDFVADTGHELERIGEAIGEDMGTVIDAIAAGEPILPHHQMAGSRIRMRGPLTLRLDSAWTTEITDRAQREVERIAGLQLRRYGYLD